MKSLFALGLVLFANSLATAQDLSPIIIGPEVIHAVSGEVVTKTYPISLEGRPSGKYLFKLQNGNSGPHLKEQCEIYTVIEQKRQCQYENLVDSINQTGARVTRVDVLLNGKRVAPSPAIAKDRAYLEFPITIADGDSLTLQVQGYPSSQISFSVEEYPTQNLLPQAFFNVSRLSGNAPLSVTFDAKPAFDPEGGALTYRWDFGDDATDPTKRIAHIYQNPGQYTAQLTVTDQNGQSAQFQALIIVKTPPAVPANKAPVAKLTVSYPDPNNLRLVHFSAGGSSDVDGSIVKTEITFGDGQKFVGSEVDHEYLENGTYSVTVRVTDDLNAAGSVAKAVRAISTESLGVAATIHQAD